MKLVIQIPCHNEAESLAATLAAIPRTIPGIGEVEVGDRDPGTLRHFSPLKRWLQRLGSWTMRQLSGTRVADSTSGFRAYGRQAALRINVVSDRDPQEARGGRCPRAVDPPHGPGVFGDDRRGRAEPAAAHTREHTSWRGFWSSRRWPRPLRPACV